MVTKLIVPKKLTKTKGNYANTYGTKPLLVVLKNGIVNNINPAC